MQTMNLTQLKQIARFFGRTITDASGTVEYFNWTCTGFEIRFTGKVLRAELVSIPARVPMVKEEAYDYPWLGVLVDSDDTFSKRFELTEQSQWYTLFESDSVETHTIRVIKLSENARGKTGLKMIETDGTLEELPPSTPSLRLEFIGDSITCGYGNEAEHRDSPFKTGEENGWIAYAALAAREMGADFRCISVSGISVSHGKRNRFPFPHPIPAMESLYQYTDKLYEITEGKTEEGQLWDFAAHPVDAIIINLGTNDVNAIKMAGEDEKDEEEQYFAEKYLAFLKHIRALNGPDPHIICTLGPLDYYLYDNIKETVAEYIMQTGDQKVHCFKYGGINIFAEGFGAIGHPSAKTHRRMANELKAKLKQLHI